MRNLDPTLPSSTIPGIFTRRVPGFLTPVQEPSPQTFKLCESGWAYSVSLMALGLVFLGVDVFLIVYTYLPVLSMLSIGFGGVGIVSLIWGISSRMRAFEVTIDGSNATVFLEKKGLFGGQQRQCVVSDLSVYKQKTCVLRGVDWHGFGAVLLTPLGPFPMALTKKEARLDTYLQELPPILQERFKGDGPDLFLTFL